MNQAANPHLDPLSPHLQALFARAQVAFDALLCSTPGQDSKTAVDAWMAATLSKLGAVPRAEFEVQREMLIALRERVAKLEDQLYSPSR